jgi:hypothetical protein
MSRATISPRPRVDLYRRPPARGPVVTLLLHPAWASVLSVLLKPWYWFAGRVETKQRTNGSPNGHRQGARGGCLCVHPGGRAGMRPLACQRRACAIHADRHGPRSPATTATVWRATYDDGCWQACSKWRLGHWSERPCASRVRWVEAGFPAHVRLIWYFRWLVIIQGFSFANVTWSDGRV